MHYDYLGVEYFLSSLESSVFTDIRKCTFIREIDFNYEGSAVLVEINPAVIIDNPNDVTNSKEYSELILLTRFDGNNGDDCENCDNYDDCNDFTNISKFPCFVHIAILNNGIKISDVIKDKQVLTKTDITTLAWGEIYSSLDDKLLEGKKLLYKT